MIECYKTIINDICTFEGVYKGKYAKFFELCEKSDEDEDDEVLAEFTTWNFYEEQEDMLWAGTVDPESVVFCKDLPGIAKGGDDAISIFAKMAYSSVGKYVWNNYREKGAIEIPSLFSLLM